MKAGQFNIHEYLEKLYEESTSMMDGGEGLSNVDGIIIPDINKKSYDWLKKEYNAKQTEVKVEISGQGSSFKPGYDLQTDVDSVKEFKPGIFGEVKTKDTKESQEGKDDDKKIPNSLDAKKTQPNFQRGEGEKPVKSDDEKNKTKPENDDIKDKKDSDDVKVKKMDLKTKKTEEDKEDKEDENKEKDFKKEKNGDKE